MTTHTHGPWTITETYTGALSINVSPQVPIATVGGAGWHLGAQTARANARLIAAAPELLEVCREALSCIERHVLPTTFAPRQRLRDAIAKADD